MIFISVDLPAPFSPSTAWISPSATFKETPSFARTPGYALRMSCSSSLNGAMVGGKSCPAGFGLTPTAKCRPALLLLEHAQVVDFVAFRKASLGRIAPVLSAEGEVDDHV